MFLITINNLRCVIGGYLKHHLFAIIIVIVIMVTERQFKPTLHGGVDDKYTTCRSKPDTVNFVDHSVWRHQHGAAEWRNWRPISARQQLVTWPRPDQPEALLIAVACSREMWSTDPSVCRLRSAVNCLQSKVVDAHFVGFPISISCQHSNVYLF